MTDGIVVRCLFLVLRYQQYLRQQHIDPNPNFPTIAQMFLVIVPLGRRQYIYSDEAQLLLDNYIDELSKQASEADSSRMTSFLAKQPSQITRITALTQIIDLLPSFIQHINIIHESGDMIGLNVRLLYDIRLTVERLFQSQITITKELVSRAIYFHEYLLERTLKIFDISSFETVVSNINQSVGKELQKMIRRNILMLSKIIITKESLYCLN
ncbi:unnamed protein product, partial [Rotaria sordida]